MIEFTPFLNKLCSLVIGILLVIVVILLGASEISKASSAASETGASANPNVIAAGLSAAGKRLGDSFGNLDHTSSQATIRLDRAMHSGSHFAVQTTIWSVRFMSTIVYQSIRWPIHIINKSVSIIGSGLLNSAEFLADSASSTFAFVTVAATQNSITNPSYSVSIPTIKPFNTSLVTMPVARKIIPTPAAAPPVVASAPLPIHTALATNAVVQTTTADNLYAWGNCTWWVFIRRSQIGEPIPNSWGNASSWANSARADGYLVDHQPSPGAIMQLSYVDHGLGHVAFVESVDSDGTWHISEMNVQGLDVEDHTSEPASAATFYNFIHNKI